VTFVPARFGRPRHADSFWARCPTSATLSSATTTVDTASLQPALATRRCPMAIAAAPVQIAVGLRPVVAAIGCKFAILQQNRLIPDHRRYLALASALRRWARAMGSRFWQTSCPQKAAEGALILGRCRRRPFSLVNRPRQTAIDRATKALVRTRQAMHSAPIHTRTINSPWKARHARTRGSRLSRWVAAFMQKLIP